MSSTYRQYQEARDTAWRALLRLTDKRLPVEPEELAALLGVEIHPFPDPKENERLWTLANQVRGVCVSLRIRGAWHMFLQDGVLDAPRRRFAVAHELGHLLLGHKTRPLSPGTRCFLSGDNQGDLMEDPQETTDYAADIFAIRLLAPACLLHELGVDTEDGITALCGLPPKAAALRAERMKLLNRRNVFYATSLERQVRDAFRPFLLSRMTPGAPKRSIPLVLPERKRPEPRAPRRRFSMTHGQKRALGALLALAALALLFLLGKHG